MALLHFLRSSREIVLTQTIQQVVSNAGDGSLRDGSSASSEFREFLTLVPVDALYTYSRQCLESTFTKNGFVLQDVVNELGRRLDFEAENGLYQGNRNSIGFDGIWRFQNESELIVEVKTTDVYSFSLETTNQYREELIAQCKVSKKATILIVVGREDTGSLEAQIRGSRFAWDIRLISVESLIKLVQIRAKSDNIATVKQIRQLLHPFEYTKIDQIIDILFTTAADVENQQDEEQIEPVGLPLADLEPAQSQEKTGRGLIEEMKERAVKGFAKLKSIDLVKRNRSYFWSAEKSLRACCTVSKRYTGEYQPYWYAYHPKWNEFLREGQGYLILGCMDLTSAFAIPHDWLEANADNLNTTERPGGQTYKHIPVTFLDNGELAINLSKVGLKYSIEPYRFAI